MHITKLKSGQFVLVFDKEDTPFLIELLTRMQSTDPHKQKVIEYMLQDIIDQEPRN